jgi:hypothetical protein
LRMIEKMKYRAPMNVERKGWVKVNILEDQQVVVEAFGWTQINPSNTSHAILNPQLVWMSRWQCMNHTPVCFHQKLHMSLLHKH